MTGRRAALFDMDRTLVRKNTAQLFTRYRRERGELGLVSTSRVAYWLLLYSLGIVNGPRVAKIALSEYRGVFEREMRAQCEEWFPRYVLPWVSEAARRTVAEHQEQADIVAIVSGATRYVTEPLARELGIQHVVCSVMEIDEARAFTGAVEDPLCFGEGKLLRTARFLERRGVALSDCTFFSDSITDLPLLAAVGQPVAINPDVRLRWAALRRSWPILSW